MTLAEMLAAADAASQGIEISEKTEFKPVPPGDYMVAVESAEGPVDSKRANPTNPSEFGKLIRITFTIVEGPHAGRKLFARNNIIVYPKSMTSSAVKNAQTAMAMGNAERKILLASIGKVGIEDASELVGATCKAKVVVGKDLNGKDRNDIKRLMPADAPAQKQQDVPASFASKPATVSKPKMPWEV